MFYRCETVLTDCGSLTLMSSAIFLRSADIRMSFVLFFILSSKLLLRNFDIHPTSRCLRPRHTMRQIAAIRRCDTSPRLYCCCDKALALSLSLRYVARIQTSLNSCDRSQRQNSVAATMIFTCHTRRFVAATCRGDVSQRFVASCVSAFKPLPTSSAE